MSTIESREYEDALPGWLKDGPGRSFLDAIVLTFDAFSASLDEVRYGLNSTSPPYDAVPFIANDRVMFRGFFEPIKKFMGRASYFRQIWRNAGKAKTIMQTVAGVWGPEPIKMRIVFNYGWLTSEASTRWITLNTDGTITRETASPANWDWDGVNKSPRAWLIVYVPESLASEVEGKFASASKYGETGIRDDGVVDKKTIGTNAYAEYAERTRAALDAIKPADVLFEYIILTFDPASFDPASAPGAAGMPDGTWTRDSKLSGTVLVRTRNATARYWKGV